MNRTTRATVFTLGTAGVLSALLVALAGPASAHVTVSAPGAARGGGDQIITFRVPTESATASTVGLKIQLPTDTPIASVLIAPVPGWSFTETTAKLATAIKTDDGDITEAVSEIDWKADSPATGFAPEEFGQFTLIAGQLPDAAQITFKAIQTYSDTTVTSWTDVAAAGSTAELDHPAPVLTLGAAPEAGSPASESSASASASATISASASATIVAAKSSSSSQTGSVIISIAALLVAIAAFGLVFLSRRPGQAAS